MAYFWLWVSIAMATASALFLKEATVIVGDLPEDFSAFPDWMLTMVSNPYTLSALFFFVLAIITNTIALSRLKLSYIFPLISVVPIALIAVFSLLLFEEKVPWLGWLAIATICVGVFLVSMRTGASDTKL